MSANVVKFKPRQAAPVSYRAEENFEIPGLMIRGFGYGTDKVTGQSIYNATLTDFENNKAMDLPLVVQNVDQLDSMTTIDAIATGEATAVRGYLETTGGESYFVVLEVTEFRRRDLAKEATVRAYVRMFEDRAKAL